MLTRTGHHEYETFDVLVGERIPQGYPVTVVQSPAGEGSALCHLNPADELADALKALDDGDTDTDFLSELGRFFFNELFTGDINFLYRTSLGMARGQGRGMRIRLRINEPELAALPWEYLYDEQERTLLATSTETTLVRYVPMRVPARPTTVQLPLRVLVVIATPQDLPSLNTEQEKTILCSALAQWMEERQVELQFVEEATVANINQAMRSFQPHVFHFVGHGAFVQDQAQVVLQDEHKNAFFIDEQIFQEFFTGSSETRLAVLNACQTATTSTSQPLVGLAPRLLQRQLGAVVAMQFPIPDRTSLIFVREFYRSLALGYPVDVAVAEARRGILQEIGSQRLDYGIPVLFLRAKDGHLFKVEETKPLQFEIPPPPTPREPPEISGFIGRQTELNYFAERLATDHLAVITGMAGVGKTALAATLTGWMADQEHIFWHSFNERSGVDGLIRDLAGFLAWHGQSDLWKLIEGTRLSGSKPPPPETLFDYLLQLLRSGRYLLCLDDFQYVDDDPSLNQFFDRLRGSLAGGDLSMIITARRTPTFVRRSAFEPLTGLGIDDVQQLLLTRNVQLTSAQIREMYTHTEGNAEFITLAIETLKQAKNPDHLIENLAKTDDVEYYLLNEVDEGLTGQERVVMGAVASLLGYPGTRGVIEAVLGGGNIFRVLMRLSERHLLTIHKGEDEREYSLHDMVRTFYYEQIRPQRRAMHRRAGEYFRNEEPDLLRAGLHFEHAGDYSEAALLATSDVWAIINRGQARALRTLLERFSPQQLETLLWLEVNLTLGQIDSLLGNHPAARTSYEDAMEQLLHIADARARSLGEARICRGMGELLERENPQEAEAWLNQGLMVVPTEDHTQKAELLLQLGTVQLYLRKYQEAEQALEQGLLLLPTGSDQLRCTALRDLGVIHSSRGELTKAQAFTKQALQISKQLHDLFQEANLLSNLGVYHSRQFDWQGAVAHFQAALAIGERLGSDKQLAMLELNLGAAYFQLGEDAQASSHLSRSLLLAEQTSNHRTELYARCRMAELLLQQQDYVAVRQHLLRAKQLVEQLAQKAHLLLIGRLEAELEFASGNLETAEQLIQQTISLAKELRGPEYLGIAQRVLGTIYAAEGKAALALEAFEASLALLETCNHYEAARTRVAFARALLVTNEVEHGRALLAEAQPVFEKLAAKRDLVEVEQLVAPLQ